MTIEKIPELENCNIVLIGSFNPAIFHPEWFVRQGLAGIEAVDPEKIKVVSRDVTECHVGPVKIICDDSRLALSVGNMVEAGKLQDLALGCLHVLAHVPISALGINHEALFKVDSEDHWHKIGHTLAPKEPVWNNLGKEPGMHQLVIQYVLQESPRLEMKVIVEPYPRNGPKHPAILLRTNLHYQMSPPSDVPTNGESALSAIEFIHSRWKEATSHARKVANAIFKEIQP